MNEVKLFFLTLFVYLGHPAYAFVCQEKGVFADPDSSDCNTFIACNVDLIPTTHYCGTNQFFWPEQKGCFSGYDCATHSMPGNVNPCEGFTSYEQIPDKNSEDCSAYYQCNREHIDYGNNITFLKVTRYTCPSGTAYRLRYGCVSVSDYTCTNYGCTTEGNFVNADSNDCSTFIKCDRFHAYNGNASKLYPLLKKCPPTTKFSPFSMKCDEFYDCNGIDPHNGNDPCLEFNWARPYVRNPHNNDCTTYLECEQGANNDRVDVIVQKTCPPSTLFSPTVGKCYYNHECNQNCSKDPCINGPGKYANMKSGQCENFIECRDTSQDPMMYRPVYEKVFCPPGALFSPITSDCDREYTCPKIPVNYCYPEIPTTPSPTTTTYAPRP